MFYDNLKTVCDASGLKITPIVNECGGAKGSISNWKKGSSPNSDIVARLAVRLNVSTDLLIFGKEKNSPTVQLTADERELLDNFKKLSYDNKIRLKERAEVLAELETPVSSQVDVGRTIEIKHSYYKVSAGTGFDLNGNDGWETIEIPDSNEARRADFALTIKGNSMEPIYFNGDIVLVKEQPAVDLGEVGIFCIEENGYIKKYGGDRLISLNAEYDDIELSDYDDEQIRCFGKVIGRV